MKLIHKTQSLCPVCLRTLDAHYVQKGQDVFFEKSCPSHGLFSVPAWMHKPNTPDFETWCQNLRPSLNIPSKNCPHNCGLCNQHIRKSCCVLLEVTKNCNMSCPICYASAEGKSHADLTLAEIGTRLDSLMQNAGAVNIQISGGEPTVRNDLASIISLCHEKGFPFVQLNTNGLNLGDSKNGAQYTQSLKDAGLNLVYLQWDGLDDKVYTPLRGGNYAKIKEQALHNCIEADLPVLLVITLVRGINEDKLGEILEKAIAYGPVVRGIHIQPVASFGRYPWEQLQAPRLTLPEVMHALEIQSHGMLQASHFHAPNSEHALCSFSALYERQAAGLMHLGQLSCCQPATETTSSPQIIAREFVARHWAGDNNSLPTNQHIKQDDFDRFLQKSSFKQRFTVSCMAFQDAYSVDLARLRLCHIHIAEKNAKLMPFCAYNLTSSQGFALHRNKEHV